MEPEDLLPHLQEFTLCPDPQPHQSSPCPHPTSRRYILILPSHLSLGLPSRFLPSGFPTKTLYEPPLSLIRATCSTHLSPLGLIIRIMSCEEYSA